MKVYGISDIGKVRSVNEDSYYLPGEGETFCAVADGMGGHNAGEVASALAIQSFAAAMQASGHRDEEALHQAVLQANKTVFSEASRDVHKRGMGTTFTALAEKDGTVHIAHVGDSRVYLIRNGAIMRVTMDHTLVEELVLEGVITVREARNHPQRHIVTRALGMSEDVEVDLLQFEAREDDVFLLCSDGLTNMVEEREILETTRGKGTWTDKLRTLVRIALDAGGNDNITALYVTFREEQHQ